MGAEPLATTCTRNTTGFFSVFPLSPRPSPRIPTPDVAVAVRLYCLLFSVQLSPIDFAPTPRTHQRGKREPVFFFLRRKKEGERENYTPSLPLLSYRGHQGWSGQAGRRTGEARGGTSSAKLLRETSQLPLPLPPLLHLRCIGREASPPPGEARILGGSKQLLVAFGRWVPGAAPIGGRCPARRDLARAADAASRLDLEALPRGTLGRARPAQVAAER
ncbi:unnamed protein product [Urochloa decumbens]|uniref:Uncharacterized protein n=1 Tax=Urochloa decumbens TaxID=240449 RepID=A0ABC8YT51_9POAL